MDTIPNEVLRMILSHLSINQRKKIFTVARIWTYLMLTFPKYPKEYSCINQFDIGYCHNTCWTKPVTIYSPDKNEDLIVINNNFKIMIFDQNGYKCKEFGEPGYGDGQFNCIEGLAVNINHHKIIISDSNNHRIQIFDYDGIFIMKFGSQGIDSGKLFHQKDVAIDHQTDNIIVRDNYRIQVFNENGDFLFKFDIYEPMWKIATNQITSDVLVMPYESNEIYIYNKEKIISKIVPEIRCNNFHRNWGLLLTNDDMIIISYSNYSNNDYIQIFDINKIFNYIIDFKKITNDILFGLTVLPNGSLVCKGENKIYIFKPDY